MIYVGCVGFPRNLSQYSSKFRFVELDTTFQQLPRRKSLAKLRKDAGEEFEFSLRAHHPITHSIASPVYQKTRQTMPEKQRSQLGLFQWTPPVCDAYEKTLQAIKALQARVLLFETPPEFTPSRQNKERFLYFFRHIVREDCLMVWEPQGPWERDDALALAKQAEVIVAEDPLIPEGFGEEKALAPQGEVAYFRLRGPRGRRHRYNSFELEEMLEFASLHKSVFISFASVASLADASTLQNLLREEIELQKEEE